MARLYSSRQAKKAACGPPKPSARQSAAPNPGNVSAQLARRDQQRQRQRSAARATTPPCALTPAIAALRSWVATGVRVLEQRAKHIGAGGVGWCPAPAQSQTARRGFQHIQGLRPDLAIDKKRLPFAGGHPARHGHGFGGGGGFVQQRGVGQRQAGQVDDHLLIVQQRFQTAWAISA